MTHDPWGAVLEEASRLRREAVVALGYPVLDIPFVDPPEGHGELGFATFQWAAELGRSPADVASELATEMETGDLLAAHASEGGYVNSRLAREALAASTLTAILDMGSEYGTHPRKGVRVLLEHTSVNPTGPIHVGRARNAVIGDTLARLLRMAGYDVTTEYLVNDAGKQAVALAWGAANISEKEVEPAAREKPDHALVPYYQRANELMESDAAVAEAVAEGIVKLEAGDDEWVRRTRETSQKVLDGILKSLKSLGAEYDSFFRESDVVLDGRVAKVLEVLRGLGAYHTENGAAYLDLEAFDLPSRESKYYLMRGDGSTLYTTRDLAYHLDKFERCDEAINVLGEDHKLEWRALCAALELMGSDRVPEGVFYSFVSLEEGRMSTRAGTMVAVDDLVDEAVARAEREVRSRREDLPDSEVGEIARMVGLGALRYNIVRVQPEKRIVFRWEEALNFEGNSAPFVQYAHARTCGILRKAGDGGQWDASLLTNEREWALLLALAKFPHAVREAAEGRRPHTIAGYANDLAAQLNQFYRDCPVLKASDDLRAARVALVTATRSVLANCLASLGIAAPRSM